MDANSTTFAHTICMVHQIKVDSQLAAVLLFKTIALIESYLTNEDKFDRLNKN